MHSPNFAQLFAFGLATSTAVNGFQVFQNTITGFGLIAHAVPASAAPLFGLSVDPFNWINQVVKTGNPLASIPAGKTSGGWSQGETQDTSNDGKDGSGDGSDETDDTSDDAGDTEDDTSDETSDDTSDDTEDTSY